MSRTSHDLILFLAALLAAAVAAVTIASRAEGRPTIRASFFNVYPSAVGSRLDNLPSNSGHCGVCHFDFNGGGPKNAYGERVAAVIPNFATRELAIASIANEDSDGDGFTNATEITNTSSYSNTPTFPGLTASNVGSVSNVNVSEITAHLTPSTSIDLTPPAVSLVSPNGGESWVGGSAHTVSWSATDNVGVTSVDLFYRDAAAAPWTPIARNLANSGSFSWFVLNTPTSTARVRAVARDAAGNTGEDQGNADFSIVRQPGGIVPTTLRDFHQPGTQPLLGGTFETSPACVTCHGGYDPAVEPGHNWKGSMMSQAMRDPLFFACLAIAEQDAPSSGDLCLRCHTPFGWLGGRSTPTDGSGMIASDRDGVACDFCHRAVDPVYKPGVSPPEDEPLLAAMLPSHVPTTYANGQFVIDPDPRKRGPFTIAGTPHGALNSAFHRSSDFCGTCHDVSNPVFERTAGADYAPGPLDQAASQIASHVLMPLERTYSEWKNSSFTSGVYMPEFAGNKPDGIVSTCQDCHLRDVSGAGANEPGTPIRPDLPLHDMTGGNAWLPTVIAGLYPGEVDAAALQSGASRATALLQKAAVVGIDARPENESLTVTVTITNRSGHKLPTGYPEGRRMWLHLVARDALGSTVFESGAYDSLSGTLDMTPEPVVYEAKLGISPALGSAIGLPGGESFHFALNDSIYKDTRIPPLGFANAAFATFGGEPVDPHFAGPGPRYADGRNWDEVVYRVPASATTVTAELLYQTTSKEYVEFLRDENTSNTKGQELYDLWTSTGRSRPVVMRTETLLVTGVADAGGMTQPVFRVLRNPFENDLGFRIDLPRPTSVTLEVFSADGRRVARRDFGRLGAGANRIAWDGRNGAGSLVGGGVYWARVRAEGTTWVEQVVKLK